MSKTKNHVYASIRRVQARAQRAKPSGHDARTYKEHTHIKLVPAAWAYNAHALALAPVGGHVAAASSPHPFRRRRRTGYVVGVIPLRRRCCTCIYIRIVRTYLRLYTRALVTPRTLAAISTARLLAATGGQAKADGRFCARFSLCLAPSRTRCFKLREH